MRQNTVVDLLLSHSFCGVRTMTKAFILYKYISLQRARYIDIRKNKVNKGFMRLRPRCISIGQLKGRYPLTPPTYQPSRLLGILLPYGMGYLILGWASHLDAFSVYPFPT